MVDLDVLKSRNIHPEALRTLLQGDPTLWAKGPTPPDDERKRANMHNRIRSRVQEGMARNFADYRVYFALDKAWDQPFQQMTSTMLGGLEGKDFSDPKVAESFRACGGLDSMLTEEKGADGKMVKKFHLPTFFNIFVPLVRAYVTIRWAKITNDRNLFPFFKFDPAKQTAANRIRCDVLTDRVQIMSSQYGYFDTMKQAVLKMLHYSFCFQFIKEEWHSEEQIKKADHSDVELGRKKSVTKKDDLGNETTTDEAASLDDEIKVVTREGLRYHLPHPTRTFVDIAHGKDTINYDSGCMFAGYWRIARYSEIQGANFWNKGAVAMGTADLIGGNSLFFTSVYSACTLTVPFIKTPGPGTAAPAGEVVALEAGLGIGALDRERQLATQYYGIEMGDQGVLVTEYFEKLIPSENGLGDYDGPVWFRFLLAGDGMTILYAAPLAACPVSYYGYDADESRSKNASMSLEVLPFQDHFQNMLSQIILTAKQNLTNLTLVDDEQVEATMLEKLKATGSRLWESVNIMSFNSKKAARGQNKVAEAIQNFNFPKGNIQELTNVLKTILDVLERVLAISSQEVAQSASHEQTREEIQTIQSSTGTRLVFTATPVDIAMGAWKRQIYASLMAYGDDDFFSHVPTDIPLDDATLKAMGFTVVNNPKVSITHGDDKHRLVKTNKKSTAIDLWQLASTRSDSDRENDKELAVAMAQIVQQLMSNPIMAQAIGAKQAIDLTNYISQLAGLPLDFKLKDATPAVTPEQQQQQAQQQLAAISQQVLATVNKEMQSELKPLLDHAKQVDQQAQQTASEVQLIVKAFAANPNNPAGAVQMLMQSLQGQPSPQPQPAPQNAPPTGTPP